jgi:hypothetical protein
VLSTGLSPGRKPFPRFVAFFRNLLEALHSPPRGVKSKIKVVMLKPAQMDIATHHFTAQYGHNGVHSSADLHLKGALQKRS